MMTTPLIRAIVLISCLLLCGDMAWAQAISADRAAAIAAGQTGGRVLNVRGMQRGGRFIYYVKVLVSGGRVRTVLIDGQTGQEVSPR